jgi:uroporphyrin-3 C-methyltransferase
MLGVLALLLALAAAGGTAYLYWAQDQARQAQGVVAARQAETAARVDELQDRIVATQRRLEQAESSQSERARALDAVERELAELRRWLESVSAERAGAERAPTLAEIEFLLRLADRELRLAGNPRVALAALREADRRIAGLDDPALAAVRAAINDEIAAVESVAGTDLEGLALRLASLAGRIDGLPLRGSLAPAPAAPGAAAGVESSGWQRFMSRVRSAAAGLFRIRRSDAPAAPLLAPDEAFFLYRNVELDLKSARLAALGRDAANYAAGLGAARAALEEYFQRDDPAVAAVIDAIDALQGRDIDPRWPAISRSLELLRAAGAED